MGLKKYYFGKSKVKANTFIGGVGATINTPALIATRLGITASRIKAFKVVGSDIEFAVTGGSYIIGVNAFSGNTAITYFDDRLGLVTSSTFGSAFYQATNLQWLNLPNMTILGYRFASGCTSLHTVSFNNLLEASSECFTGCSNLINFGNSFLTLDRIGNVAFQGCSKITELILPNVKLCNQNGSLSMFASMFELVTLYAPQLTLVASTTNGANMFQDCGKLENVTLTALNFIPRNFVTNCVKLKTLNLPNATSGNYQSSFSNTPLLETLNTPNITSLLATYLGFFNSGIIHIDLSKVTNLTVFANETFQGTTRLATLDIRSGTTSIGASSSANNNVFNLMKTGVSITANIVQQTINAGAVEPDLQFAITNRGATVTYV